MIEPVALSRRLFVSTKNHMSKILYAAWIGAGVFLLLAAPVHAADFATYKSLVNETIKEIDSGDLKDPQATLARQEKAIAIGIEACKERAKADPKDAKLMDLVVASAAGLKTLTAEEIEEKWGDEGTAGDAAGVPLKSLQQFSVARSTLDLVIHPARVHAFLRDYAKTKNKLELQDAKGELVEVLHHAEVVEKAK